MKHRDGPSGVGNCSRKIKEAFLVEANGSKDPWISNKCAKQFDIELLAPFFRPFHKQKSLYWRWKSQKELQVIEETQSLFSACDKCKIRRQPEIRRRFICFFLLTFKNLLFILLGNAFRVFLAYLANFALNSWGCLITTITAMGFFRGCPVENVSALSNENHGSIRRHFQQRWGKKHRGTVRISQISRLGHLQSTRKGRNPFFIPFRRWGKGRALTFRRSLFSNTNCIYRPARGFSTKIPLQNSLINLTKAP